MKIQDLKDKISSYFPKLPKDAVQYTKNAKLGDFMIHTFKYPNIEIPTIPNTIIMKQGTTLYFTMDKTALAPSILKSILFDPYFSKKKPTGQFFIIEYSSPNIAKKFHPGHLRTTILGNFIKNLCETMGVKTHSINYLGDWGKQFGLLGVGFEKFGSEEEMIKDPLKHLYDVYVKTNTMDLNEEAKAWFTELESGNKENLALWCRFRELSIEKYKELYAVLNCKFDEYSGESLYGEMGRTFINMLENKESISDYINEKMEVEIINNKLGHLRTEEEQIILDKDIDIPGTIPKKETCLENETIKCGSIVQKDENAESRYIDTSFGKVCVLKKDGSTLYVTRDIAAIVDRIIRFNPDKIIYVVASQQDLHFKQLFECMHMANVGYKNGENILEHINYGLVEGMSTRKGNVEFLEDIIDEARNVMLDKMKANINNLDQIDDINKTSEILAVTALIVHDFSARRIKGYKFNINECTEIHGFTGPYLQYTHCRLRSIENKNLDVGDFENLNNNNLDEIYSGKSDEKLNEIVFTLSKYPYILEKCMIDFEPSLLVNYLMDLCKSINGIISLFRVMNEEKELAVKRLIFYRSCRIVLGNGLKVLGITPLDRM